MKNPKSLVIAFFALLTITSCEPSLIKSTETKSDTVSTPTASSKEINDLTWKITLLNSDVITGSQQNFYLKLNSTGTFESKAGCNQINGEFKINNQFISFSKIVTTKMFCANTMAIENSFISILNQTHKIVVIDSSKFILIQDDIVIAQFELVK